MNGEKELTYILQRNQRKLFFNNPSSIFKIPLEHLINVPYIHSGNNNSDIMLSFVKYIYLNHRYKYNYRYKLQLAYTKTLQCS